MKYLKTYENIKIQKPTNGDYVIVEYDDLEEFFQKQIGILKYSYYDDNDLICVSQFVDTNGEPILIESFLSDIKYWTKNKKDAEIYLTSKKYNL